MVSEPKVYLDDKIAGKKGSSFEWEQWWKMISLGLRNLTDKTSHYGRCRWKIICIRKICTYHWVEKQRC